MAVAGISYYSSLCMIFFLYSIISFITGKMLLGLEPHSGKEKWNKYNTKYNETIEQTRYKNKGKQAHTYLFLSTKTPSVLKLFSSCTF
jgi:hypothetical protein